MIFNRGKFELSVPSWVWWAAACVLLAFLAWENYPLPGNGNAKDWRFFYPAAEALIQGTDLYESGVGGYVYPPLLAFLVTPLVPLGYDGSAQVWLGLELAALASALVLTVLEISRRLPANRGSPRVGTAVLLGLILSIELARRELDHTQTDWITLLSFVLGLRWIGRRPFLAGGALGLAANVKYHTLLVVPYLLLRGRPKAAGMTVAFALAAALAPAMLIGWDRNLAYLGRAFGGIAQFVGIDVERRAGVWEISNLDSISATSALARLAEKLGGGTGLTLTLIGAAAAACIGLAWWMYRVHQVRFWSAGWIPDRSPALGEPGAGNDNELREASIGQGVAPGGMRGPGGLVLAAEWMGLMVATLAFSPQTLKRHMFLLVPVFVMTGVMLLARGRHGEVQSRRGTGGSRQGFRIAGLLAGKRILLAGLVIAILALMLPPRFGTIEAASNAWRAVGGASWGLLVWFFALLWTALSWERAERLDRAGVVRAK